MVRHLTAHNSAETAFKSHYIKVESSLKDRCGKRDRSAQIQAHVGSVQKVAGASQVSIPEWRSSPGGQSTTPCSLCPVARLGYWVWIRQDHVLTVQERIRQTRRPHQGGGGWCRMTVLSIPWAPPTIRAPLKVDSATQKVVQLRDL